MEASLGPHPQFPLPVSIMVIEVGNITVSHKLQIYSYKQESSIVSHRAFVWPFVVQVTPELFVLIKRC